MIPLRLQTSLKRLASRRLISLFLSKSCPFMQMRRVVDKRKYLRRNERDLRAEGEFDKTAPVSIHGKPSTRRKSIENTPRKPKLSFNMAEGEAILIITDRSDMNNTNVRRQRNKYSYKEC